MDTNLQKYMAFIKIVEYKSFTKAAEYLHYSQPVISRIIRDLEKEWELRLFERNKGTVELTTDGLAVYPQVMALCSEYEKLSMTIDERKGLQTGMIRIGAFSSVATHRLSKMIRSFHDDYPNIQYEILIGDYAEIEKWILEGRVDCGFVNMPVKAELDTMFFERDRIVAVLPPDHPLTEKETVTLEDLVQDPFLLQERGNTSTVRKMFETAGLTPNICFTIWEDYASMSLVEQGLCISAIPNLILTRMPYDIVIKDIEPATYRDIGFAMKNRKTASFAVRRFMEYLDMFE